MAAADAEAASRNTSRGCTTVESSEPIDTIRILITRCLVSSMTMPNCSTAPAPYCERRIGGELARRREPWTFRHASHERATAQLNGSDDPGRPSRPHARHVSQTVEADARQAVHAAGAGDETVGELKSVGVARAAAEHEREQLVVAEARGTQAFQLLARAVVWCHVFHRRYTQGLMGLRWFPAPACFLLAFFVSGCAEPPNKEMDQAQGAIDAARAAGADRYATTEYSAATDALTNANAAVAARDYRLALNHALESRERAQNAARDAADAKALVHVEVDRAVSDITTLVTQGRTRLAAAERARVPHRLLEQPGDDLTEAEADLQEAGEAVAAGDYLRASATMEGLKERVERALAAIDAAVTSQSSRRRR